MQPRDNCSTSEAALAEILETELAADGESDGELDPNIPSTSRGLPAKRQRTEKVKSSGPHQFIFWDTEARQDG